MRTRVFCCCIPIPLFLSVVAGGLVLVLARWRRHAAPDRAGLRRRRWRSPALGRTPATHRPHQRTRRP